MWYEDNVKFRGLGEALANAGAFEDSDVAALFNRKPQRFNDHYLAWEANEFPTSEEDDGWDDFLEAIENDEEEEGEGE